MGAVGAVEVGADDGDEEDEEEEGREEEEEEGREEEEEEVEGEGSNRTMPSVARESVIPLASLNAVVTPPRQYISG